MKKFFTALPLFILSGNLLVAQPFGSTPCTHLPGPMVINPGIRWTKSVDSPLPEGLACQLSFDRISEGSPVYIWSSYQNGSERIYTADYKNGRRSRTRLLSAGEGIYFSPVFVLTGENSGWAVWQHLRGDKWEIAGRHLKEGIWGPTEMISGEGQRALFPSVAVFSGGIAVAWENHSSQPQQIEMRIWNGAGWENPEYVSPPGNPSYRPDVVPAPGGELWVVWDSYDGSRYCINGRQVRPVHGKTEQITGTDNSCRNNLKPVGLFSKGTGLICAWISVIDVAGGKGVIDKWNTIRVAVRKENGWQLSDDRGEYEIADLRHGLLCSVEPPGPVWGYSGRRRNPILVENNGEAWLLWERKTEHDGPATTLGELCGRCFNGTSWSEPYRLHSGMVNYHIPSSRKTFGNRLTLTAMNGQNQYYSFNISPEYRTKLTKTELAGWEYVRLPLNENSARNSVEFNGKIYNLYWGDLHCHTVLTPDAEGEVDELMHFARDRAGIDVVVMQENDAASWLNTSSQGIFQGETLSESAYRLSVYFSRKYTEPGRFIALPGWEWSDRTDDGNPNHRTVIFAGEETPILRHTENRGNFMELCDAVEAAGGVMNTQHESFQLVNNPVDANIEVVAGWGNYLEPPEKIHSDLSKGFKVGFVATSDGHRLNPGTGGGLTGIYAPELTPEAILEALKLHRVYATNGNRMFIDARANGIFMGQDVESTGAVEFYIRAVTPRRLVRATLIRDGERIHSIEGEGKYSMDALFTDSPGKGFHWYYWEIRQEGEWPDYPGNVKVAEGHMGWSSPHRVYVQ